MKKFIKISSIKILFGFLITSAINANDQKLIDKENQIVAQIGDQVIYEKDFIANYEFGLPQLKVGETTDEKKLTYLNFLVNEKLLSLEAKKLGLFNSKDYQNEMRKIKNDLLLQYTIQKIIMKKINLTFDEIKMRINKNKTSFKITLWPELHKDDADFIKYQIENEGIENTIKLVTKENPFLNINKEYFETDYLHENEIPSKIFDAVKKLPIGKVSNPIEYNGAYYLAMVNDVRRSSVMSNEYNSQYPTVRKQLFNEKLQNEIANFTDSIISPRNILLKKKVFKKFADIIIGWYQIENPKVSVSEFYFEKLVLDENKILSSENLIEFIDGKLNSNDIIEFFRFDLLKKEYLNNENKYALINQILSLSIRDYFWIQNAQENEYDKTEWMINETKKWDSKLGFNLFKNYLSKNTDPKSLRTNLLNSSEELRKKYNVKIFAEALKNIEITNSEKSKNTFTPIYLLGTNRLAEPIVDAIWKN
ncbi:MAG: hypothetical protein IPM32_12570 [Ignavibacteriae bacterium]|nr:hypothetical protein [Ignavibacteriota bacterium]